MIPQLSTNSLIPGVVPAATSPVTGSSLLNPGVNAVNAGSVLPSTSFDATNGGVSSAVQSTLQMITLLLEQMLGGSPATGQAAPGLDQGAALAGGAGTANAGGVGAAAGGTAIANDTADPQQAARLDDVLAKVAQDPEGSKLLAAAKEKGYTIEVGDPSAAAGGSLDKGNAISCPHCKAAMDAGQQVNGVTLSGDQKKIVINPNAPDFEKTVVHELVHAATDGDDNSQQEEGIADVIGYRVANRITGKAQPGDAQTIYQNKMANYQELNGANDVRGTLAALGIDAGI